ncbi:peptidoglycan bridge formation glycyltransferase FemA/FemB family protein, partial [Patescibacteria group bacterium]|nr:peptidoglycan bridge formation glycyltransferase FemA/FemB family protein [Patescibacteria group bacterium]
QELLFVAEYEGKVIAANIVVIFGSRATYLHGATSSEHREVMAPHLLQWEQIKYAKSQGCAEYDFWGIVNEHTLDKRGQSWEGFTRFKRGFGGQEVNYVGYWDYPLDKLWYFLYRLVQKFRR